jgi:hypothetical protein
VLTLQQRGAREARIGVSGRFADAMAIDDPFTVTVADQAFSGRVKAVLPVPGELSAAGPTKGPGLEQATRRRDTREDSLAGLI